MARGAGGWGGVVAGLSGLLAVRPGRHDQVSVFDVEVGDCFTAPEEITTTFTTLDRVDATCRTSRRRTRSRSTPTRARTTTPETFPGEAALKSFADGACAQEYADYVGVDYRDSELFFTYLLPSPRSWEQDEDRTTLCFVTTTDGVQLTQSVRGDGVVT